MERDESLGPTLSAAVVRWRSLPPLDPRNALCRAALRTRLAALPVPQAGGRVGPSNGRAVRWAAVSAVAASVLIALSLRTPPQVRARSSTPDLAATASPVVFSLDAGDASRVSLAGDFNGWSDRGPALTRIGSRWSVTISLAAGRYAYAFRVDDRWVADELAPRAPQDFGPPASILIVSNGNP